MMKYRFIKVRTFILFIAIKIMIVCAGEECKADRKECSGQGSRFNPSTGRCECGESLWGTHCEYGRHRLTSRTGHIVESEGKYHCKSKYMYLIESGRANMSIQIKLNLFKTECNWDYLFIFDGRSVYDPLIASYSGIIKGNDNWVQINETNFTKSVTTKSGAAYLYFYSDALITEEGFNVSYTISNCSAEQCNGHGICSTSGTCQCEEGWSGVNCTKRLCCREVNSLFHAPLRSCRVCPNDYTVAPRASHAVAIRGNIMYVYGGYSFDKHDKNRGKIIQYDLDKHEWIQDKTWDAMANGMKTRHGHSMVCYGDHIIVFGGNHGNITNELWQCDIKFQTCKPLKPKGRDPIAVYGHASVLIRDAMYTFFGFNKELLYTKYVQKFNTVTEKWSIVGTSGAIVNGRFGHTATYDHQTDVVFVFGGFYSKSVDSKLLLFHVKESKWTMEDAFKTPRMLHAAGIIGNNLVIFGGNEHKNDQNVDDGGNKCFSSSLMVYSIRGEYSLKTPLQYFHGKERYGHSAVIYNKSMHIFGGFDGTFKSDVFQIRISGDCLTNEKKEDCLNELIVAGCMWDTDSDKCITTDTLRPESSVKRPEFKTVKRLCKQYTNCVDCTNHQCYWNKEAKGSKAGKAVDQCYAKDIDFNVHMEKKIGEPRQCEMKDIQDKMCQINSGCVACSKESNCTWNASTQKCNFDSTEQSDVHRCFPNNYTSCEDIQHCNVCIHHTQKMCMWCESRKKCLFANSYKVTNPYGQCLEWISANHITPGGHDCKGVICKHQRSCNRCQQIAGCGWCEDDSGTGLGTCMEGGDRGPIGNNNTCPRDHWSFTKCPACHCNGHSKCIKDTDNCTKCHGNVEGKHCDKCKEGYYGKPENNGTCIKCFCNGHFRSCETDGTCACDMLGAEGKSCQLCTKTYSGSALNGGICFFPLQVGYEYPANNLTDVTIAGYRVNQKPKAREKQITFKIEKTGGTNLARLNLSIYYEDKESKGKSGKSTIIEEAYLLTDHPYTKPFSEKDYEDFPGGGEIRAIVYGIPEDEYFSFKITVTSPQPLFNLIYFLIMFLVCFCSLLIILIVLWKIKQRYDIYIHNRQQRHEHAERISRPFRAISIFLHDMISSYQKVPPSLIVCEQFANGNLAVASVIIELPRAGNGFSPTDHSGICIGSTLVTTPQRWTFTQMQQKYGCDRRRRKNVEQAVAV